MIAGTRVSGGPVRLLQKPSNGRTHQTRHGLEKKYLGIADLHHPGALSSGIGGAWNFKDRVRVPQRPSAVDPAAAVATTPAPVFMGKAVLKLLSGGSLEDIFMSMPVNQACREAAVVMVCVLFVGFFGKKVFHSINSRLQDFSYYMFKTQDPISAQDEDAKRSREENRARRNVLLGLLDALSTPVEALIPIYCSMFALNVLLTIGKVAMAKLTIAKSQQQLNLLRSVFENMCSKGIEFLFESTELVLVVFIGWTLLRVKEKAIAAIADIVKSSSFHESDVMRFLQPFSQLLTWGILLGSILSALLVVGIDVGPMLAVGSVSTIAIGFAAQSTVSNLVAALSLYTNRSFITGDRVQFKSLGGSTVVSGTVKDIQPMKTLVKCDNGSLVYVNNKDLATSLMVVNESEISKSKLSSSIPVIEEELIVQYKDVDKVQSIVEEIGEFLKMHPDLDTHLTRRCCVMGFCTDGVRVLIKGTMAVHARSRRGEVYTDIFLTSERIVRKHGAFLSQTFGYEMPNPLD